MIDHLLVSMACTTFTDKYLCDFHLWERDSLFNRKVIDATVALSIGSRLIPGATDRDASLDRYQSMLLEELIISCPLIDSTSWKSRMVDILHGDVAYKFIDVAPLVNVLIRYTEKYNMEELMLTGLLFRVFDFRVPDLTHPSMRRIAWQIVDMHKRAMITNGTPHVSGDMRQDTLRYRSDIKRCFAYVASSINTADHLDNWSADAITIGNAFFLECGLGYISRTSPFDLVNRLFGRMWPQHAIVLPKEVS